MKNKRGRPVNKRPTIPKKGELWPGEIVPTNKNPFKWHEPPPPLVTKCCVSLSWSEVQSEPPGNGGTYCYKCKTVKQDNVREITPEELEKVSIIAEMTPLHEEYQRLMQKMNEIIANSK